MAARPVAIVSKGYGKNSVRVMRLRREGDVHFVAELCVNVELELSSDGDYKEGNNVDVVPTDTQKNTVFVLAKRHGISTPEEFTLLLSSHFLETYPQVIRCQVSAEQYSWQRLVMGGASHNHVFVSQEEPTRFCMVSQTRYSKTLSAGLKGLRLLKTTKSGFTGFHKDQYTSLPEVSDRVFCTEVYCKYSLALDQRHRSYDDVWQSVKAAILEVFAGPPQTGVYSPSVQKTLYDAGSLILSRQPIVGQVELHMPNIHYFLADLAKLGIRDNTEVFMPVEAPQGTIKITVERPISKY